ncbi:MAG: hypothetical protein LBJ96_05955, partial [Holosporaceae bacterium]|nr:hypothetical protein [Holosporaceae bacterium]
MLKKITLCCAVFAMIACDRIPQDNEKPLIPRSVLQSNPEKFGVQLNHAGDKIAYFARKGHEVELRID